MHLLVAADACASVTHGGPVLEPWTARAGCPTAIMKTDSPMFSCGVRTGHSLTSEVVLRSPTLNLGETSLRACQACARELRSPDVNHCLHGRPLLATRSNRAFRSSAPVSKSFSVEHAGHGGEPADAANTSRCPRSVVLVVVAGLRAACDQHDPSEQDDDAKCLWRSQRSTEPIVVAEGDGGQ